MTAMTADRLADIVERYPDVFHRSCLARYSKLLIAAGVGLYLVFAWNLFTIGQVMQRGSWDIAGSYLADWVSYEVRPDIGYHDGYLDVEFPRFSPLGSDPKPDWLVTDLAEVTVQAEARAAASAASTPAASGFLVPGAKGTATGFMAPGAATGGATVEQQPDAVASAERKILPVRAVVDMGSGSVAVEPYRVLLNRGSESLLINIGSDGVVRAEGELPDWAVQRRPGEKIIASFGLDGRVEVEDDEVKIRQRFLGWENFVFDPSSAFWNRGFGDVMAAILWGERIKSGQSNLSLAVDNFLYNAEWQHADVFIKLGQTIVMAFVGTLFATAIAFPLSFMAARNITPSFLTNQVTKRLFDFLRSVDMLIWALFFTRAFGPGPLAGISAIFFTDTGTLGKLYSEALENIDEKQREGVRSLGANPVLVQRFGVVPQVLPVFVSQSLYFWESNTRSATIIGAVGAGGIGLKLWEAMRTNADWENVAYMVLLILVVVYVFDTISARLRGLLIGRGQA
ncbi:phosphonate ABC transporter, permease protein PhnE [Hoeflea ulvae]|uniref:Phosphonate ABC transporter, permease protein PhnE n=1 Tax=Hoeflea ulvae TaxID=2983764 RepID=A0ABT3YIH1_9HYPH|nr:phosphonate ABC transporter, permease protein PhnE [Hoeflea ulvae]MCY0095594.1 phosphonate ABC transporter, permease protein PhnE [Hoeflea ulvae]